MNAISGIQYGKKIRHFIGVSLTAVLILMVSIIMSSWFEKTNSMKFELGREFALNNYEEHKNTVGFKDLTISYTNGEIYANEAGENKKLSFSGPPLSSDKFRGYTIERISDAEVEMIDINRNSYGGTMTTLRVTKE